MGKLYVVIILINIVLPHNHADNSTKSAKLKLQKGMVIYVLNCT